MQADREAWLQLTNDAEVCKTTDQLSALYKAGDTKRYDALKRSLPMVCFMCTFDPNEGGDPKKPRPTDTWRLQKAARLNGLIMHDYDHLSQVGLDPKVLWQSLPSHWFDENSCATPILLGHNTPSGDGLRLVTIANPDLNIEQNQQALLAQIKAINPELFAGLEADGQCINADRGSFVVGKQNILYISETLFTYDNPKYDEKFGPLYRSGHVSGSTKRRTNRTAAQQKADKVDVQKLQSSVRNSTGSGVTLGKQPEVDAGVGHIEKTYPDKYHDVEYAKILDAWFEQNGGEPEPGDRHKMMLRLVADLRYICSNDPDFIRSVIMQRDFIQRWVKDDGAGRELDDIINSSCEKELWWGTPKRLKAALDAVGVSLEARRKPDSISEDEEREAFLSVGCRLKPLLVGPYADACSIVSDENILAAIFASGTMYCTLMTRCWYEHYDGRPTRLNPTTFIIGHPGSGKSFADRLNTFIMPVMKNADAPGRKAEREYKRQKNERATSSKAQKGEALKLPEEMIRYLPSKTSNNIFFRRAENAKEIIDGEVMHLHLYMFDSELDSAVGAQKSDWAGKHDLELKAFHNEYSGVDYANNDSVNDLIQVFWNQVITGTPVSLQKKFSLRNINDGFCTRVAITKMWPKKYKMMARGSSSINHETGVRLKEWGYRFDSMKGELQIGKLVDYCYDLCAEYAEQAGENEDDVLDLLRKRAVYYAIWFTIPRIYGRQWESYRETGKVDIDDDDLRFASIIYEAVIYWQDYYFGRMLADSWRNAENEVQPRKRNSKAAQDYGCLPQEFDVQKVQDVLGLDLITARQRITRWQVAGYIKNLTPNKRPAVYTKVVTQIMV